METIFDQEESEFNFSECKKYFSKKILIKREAKKFNEQLRKLSAQSEFLLKCVIQVIHILLFFLLLFRERASSSNICANISTAPEEIATKISN